MTSEENSKISLPAKGDISRLKSSPRKSTSTKQKEGDIKFRYIPPNSERNPSSFWILPRLGIVLSDLRLYGGQLSKLLLQITEDADLQSRLLLQLEEQLTRPKNEKYLNKFNQLLHLGQKIQMQLGLEKQLSTFRNTGEINASTLSKLGQSAMPETFGGVTQSRADREAEAAKAQQRSELEKEMQDLG